MRTETLTRDVLEPDPSRSLLLSGLMALLALVALRSWETLSLWQTGKLSSTDWLLYSQLVAPRLTAAAVAGAGLGVAGVLLQGLTRNPIASPGICGITAGAHLALVLALAFALPWPPVVLAFVGACSATALTWTVAGAGRREGAALPLAGIAVNLALSAIAAAMTLLNDQQMASAFLWSAGAPIEIGWPPVASLAPWIALGLLLAWTVGPHLDALATGDDAARGLGVSLPRTTLATLGSAALMSGAAVGLAGPIAFIGLVAPNALRRLGVYRHRPLVWSSALWGAVLLTAADSAAVALSSVGREITTGLLTAILGAPVLVYLVRKRTRPTAAAPPTVSHTERRRLGALALPAFLVVLTAGLVAGDPALSPIHLLRAFTDVSDPLTRMLALELRLPRLLVAAGAGALLALAGQLLQAALRNPLAAPETLGIVQGAALAALLALVAGAAPGGLLMQIGALAGAGAVAAALVILPSGRGQDPASLILIGIAVAALLAALAALATLLAQLQAARAVVWLTGSVYGRGWPQALALLPLGLVAVIGACALAPRLDIAALGDTKAATLGVEPARLRMAALALAAVATAAAVSVAGSLAFVGLLAPHLTRLLHPGRNGVRLPTTLLLGATLTMLADTLGRTLWAPTQLPAGVMTALVGAPYFLWLLRRRT